MSIAEKLITIAENEQKVYDAGFQAGSSQGGNTDAAYNEGYSAGQKAEHDKFWDALQDSGKRTDYSYTFYKWDIAKGFYPKYDITPTSCSFLFRAAVGIVDLAERLNECGVKLDLSQTTLADSTFYASKLTRVPEICFEKWVGKAVFFGYSSIETVDKFTVHSNFNYTNIFACAYELKNITFGSPICSSLNMSYSPLTVDSMKDIIHHLKIYAGTEYDGVYKLTFSDECWQALEASGPTFDGLTWKEYVVSRGWQV